MAYLIGDIFIGDHPVTQSFGARPEVYAALYGLKGHNGTDFGTPSLTPILSAADGFVSEIGFDSGGYGNYIKIVHDGYLSLYGHLNDTTVKLKDRMVRGQLIGHSDNTGFSDAPHIHFGVAPCDVAGNKTEQNNGYSGYIDPNGERCHWTITNPTAPITPPIMTPDDQLMPNVTRKLYTELVMGATNNKDTGQYLNMSDNDINSPDFAKRVVIPTIEQKTEKIKELENQVQELQTKVTQLEAPQPQTGINSTQEESVITDHPVFTPPPKLTEKEANAVVNFFKAMTGWMIAK